MAPVPPSFTESEYESAVAIYIMAEPKSGGLAVLQCQKVEGELQMAFLSVSCAAFTSWQTEIHYNVHSAMYRLHNFSPPPVCLSMPRCVGGFPDEEV